MKIGIVGAGAMGCVFGACLAETESDVVLVDVAPAVVEAINTTGVTVHRDGVQRHVPVHATSDPSSVGRVDAVIFLVKSFHTQAAAELARPMVDDSTIVATLQNGMGNSDILAEVFDPDRIVLGVTAESGTSLGPAVVDHPGNAITFVGPYRGESLETSERLAAALNAAGFETEATLGIETEIWKKLVVGASTLPAPALLDMACGPLMHQADMRELMDETAREVVAVARAVGHDIDPDERIAYIHELLLAVETAKGSMVQDIAAGRRTEIDMINGGVVREAERTGVDAPINRTLVALVRGWEHMRGFRS
jgi:2-dehydropantoate 2-reductase